LAKKHEGFFSQMPFVHGITNGGNPLGGAACVATIAEVEERKLLDNERSRGEQLQQGLQNLMGKYSFIGEVRGHGLLRFVEMVKDRATKEPIQEDRLDKLVELANDAKLKLRAKVGVKSNCLMICPPFIITAAEVDDLVGRLDSAMQILNTTNEQVKDMSALGTANTM